MFPIHARFPKEMAVIGRLLVDYGELELDLMNCVRVLRNCDLNSTLKSMFRVRGETNRIDIADALGRVPYTAVKMTTEFDAVIAAMRQCLRIRNRYAHAFWGITVHLIDPSSRTKKSLMRVAAEAGRR